MSTSLLELKAELIQEGYIKLKQGKKAAIKVRKDKVYQPHYLVLEQGKIGFGMNVACKLCCAAIALTASLNVVTLSAADSTSV